MKTKFFQISLGISLMLFAAGFFVRSFATANAAPATLKNIQQSTNAGTYQFCMLLKGVDEIILRGNSITGDMEMWECYNNTVITKISH
jgi:hypothetical protein